MSFHVAQTAIAVRLRQLVTGRLPGGLGELVPEYLDEVPIDEFTGAPIGFAQSEKEWIVFSVSSDGERDGDADDDDKDDIIVRVKGTR